MENPIKMDDLGVPLFLQTPKSLFGISNFKYLCVEVSWGKMLKTICLHLFVKCHILYMLSDVNLTCNIMCEQKLQQDGLFIV